MSNRIEVELDATGDLIADLARAKDGLARVRSEADKAGAELKSVKIGPDGAASWRGVVKDFEGGSLAIRGKLSGLKTQAEQATESLDDLGTRMTQVGQTRPAEGGMFSAVFWGNLAVAATQAMLTIGTQAIASVKNNLDAAAAFQTQSIGTASDIGTNLGISLTESRAMLEETQLSIADIAAALPGMTSDYTAILNGIAPSMSDAFEGNAEGFQAAILDVTKRAGVLAAKSGADAEMGASGLNRFIAGTSGFQEVMTIDLFQKNAQLQKALRDGLANMGKTTEDWKDLTTAQRLAITQAALQVATPDTLLAEYEGTAEALMQGMQTALFDPLKGLFGSLRKVDSRDGRTALDAYTGLLQSITDLGTSLSAAGLTFDPMAALIDLLDWLADLTNGVNLLLSAGPDLPDLSGGLSGLQESLLAGLNGAMSSIDWVGVGSLMTAVFLDAVVVLGKVLLTTDWSGLQDLLLSILKAGLQVMAGALLEVFRRTGNLLQPVLDSIGGMARRLLDMIAGVSRILNPIGAITGQVGQAATGTVSPSSARPLPAPQPSGKGNQSVAFSPSVSVNTNSQADPDQIASAISNRLSEMYRNLQQDTLGYA